jgi:trimeric autotransporter adhesin
MANFSRAVSMPRPRNPGFTRPIGNRPVVRIRGGFGALTSQQDAQLASVAAGTAASAIATGAAAGSVAGPIGTAVGAVVGVVVGILTKSNNTASHIGTWDAQLVQALSALPSTAQGLGRQFAWNENSHGLVQMIEALLATGIYMAWDTSLISNYDVCAHWASTFGLAVQNVATAVCQNKAGAKCTVSVALSPGAGGFPPFNFTFTNPGISVGPDAVAATVIMGKSGLMGAMMTALGGQAPQNIASNESNASAQKVYSLMVDYWAAQVAPAAAVPSTPVPVVKPAVTAAATAANTAAAAGHNPVTAAVIATTPAPAVAPTVTGTTASGTPVVAPSDTAALISTLIANGQSQTDAINAGMASLEANGVNSQAPASQAALQTSAAPGLFGLSTTELLIGAAAIAAGLYLIME